MPWYAIDAVTDAIDEASALLLPFDLRRWVVLAIITFFVGGAGGAPSLQQTFEPPTQGNRLPETLFGVEFWTLVALVGLALLAVVLVLLLVGSVMEFVFVDALRSRDVRIRGPFGRRVGAGLRLAGFRILVLLAGLLVAALVFAPIGGAVGLGSPVFLLALVVTVPLAIVFGLALVVVQEFTTAFVVPLVCDTGGGIVATWRHTLWPGVRDEWQQFLLYAVLKWGIGIAVGFATSIVLGLVFLPVLLLVGAGIFVTDASAAVLVVGGVFVVVLAALALLFVRMPIAVFVRYFSLLVLDASGLDWTLRTGATDTPAEDEGPAGA